MRRGTRRGNRWHDWLSAAHGVYHAYDGLIFHHRGRMEVASSQDCGTPSPITIIAGRTTGLVEAVGPIAVGLGREAEEDSRKRLREYYSSCG